MVLLNYFSKIGKFRFVVCGVLWFALFSMYTERLNLSVGIVGMIANYSSNTSKSNTECPRPEEGKSSVYQMTEKFDWDSYQRNILLLGYNVGYLLNHVLGAILAKIWGCRRVMNVCLALSSIFTIVSVIAPNYFWFFFLCRAICGLSQGPLYPIVIQIMADYAPIEERTWIMLCTHSGNIMALIFTFLSGGAFVEYVVNGWKYVFFISGGLGIVSTMLWFIFVFDTPEDNPWLSNSEKNYIVKSIYPNGRPSSKKLSEVPFKAICLSVHTYIFLMAHFGKLIVLYMNLFGLVLFIKDFFSVTSFQASYLSAIPFTVDFLAQLIYPKFISKLKTQGMGNTNVRRLSNFIGAVGCSIFLIPVGFVSCHNVALGVALISLSLAFIPCFQAGYYVASVEIAPQHSLIVGSIVNMGGTFAGILQRYFTGHLLMTFGIRDGYLYSFIITSGCNLIFSTIFSIFGTAELQPWAKNPTVKTKVVQLKIEKSSSDVSA